MANAYKCDRCGMFFERDGDYEKDVKYRMTGGKYDRYYIAGYAPVHLCPNCSKALHTWMEYKDKPTMHHVYLKNPTDLYINIHHPNPVETKTFVKEKKKRWWRK